MRFARLSRGEEGGSDCKRIWGRFSGRSAKTVNPRASRKERSVEAKWDPMRRREGRFSLGTSFRWAFLLKRVCRWFSKVKRDTPLMRRSLWLRDLRFSAKRCTASGDVEAGTSRGKTGSERVSKVSYVLREASQARGTMYPLRSFWCKAHWVKDLHKAQKGTGKGEEIEEKSGTKRTAEKPHAVTSSSGT